MPTKVLQKRGTRSALNALASANGIDVGQVYLITDESRLAIGTSVSTYQAFLKEGEGGGGGSITVNSASVLVSPAEYDETVAVVSVPGVLATSKVLCWVSPNEDFDVDDLTDVSVRAVPAVNSINFFLYGDGPIVGTYLINYIVGN